VLTAAHREQQMMLRFVPRAPHLGPNVRLRRNDDDCVGSPEVGYRHTIAGALRGLHVALAAAQALGCNSIRRKYQRDFRVPRRALRGEIEMSQLRYLVAPEFHAYGIRHSEPVHVEDSAAHAELSDILDHVDTLEPYGIEMFDQLAQLAYVTLPQLEP